MKLPNSHTIVRLIAAKAGRAPARSSRIFALFNLKRNPRCRLAAGAAGCNICLNLGLLGFRMPCRPRPPADAGPSLPYVHRGGPRWGRPRLATVGSWGPRQAGLLCDRVHGDVGDAESGSGDCVERVPRLGFGLGAAEER